MLPAPRDKFESKAIADIEQFGLHIMNVLEDGDQPNFSYSLGLWHTYKHPEVIIFGLDRDISGWILNEISRNLQAGGEEYQVGEYYPDFLEGFEITFFEVPKSQYQNHVGWDLWLYNGPNFPLIQCVWPGTDGIFPWEDGAPDWFRSWQPVLKFSTGS